MYRKNTAKIPVWQNPPTCNNFQLPCFVLSCFLFREMVRNSHLKVCFYSCTTERNSELFSLPRKGSWNETPRVATIFVPRNGILSCFLFHGRVWNWIPRVFCSLFYKSFLTLLVGFGSVCTHMHSAHPSFWANERTKRGLVCPPAYRSFAAPSKNKLFLETNAFLQAWIRAARSVQFSTRLSLTLLSYIAPHWAIVPLTLALLNLLKGKV